MKIEIIVLRSPYMLNITKENKDYIINRVNDCEKYVKILPPKTDNKKTCYFCKYKDICDKDINVNMLELQFINTFFSIMQKLLIYLDEKEMTGQKSNKEWASLEIFLVKIKIFGLILGVHQNILDIN